MDDIVEYKLREWVKGKALKDARIAVYNNIRDIPYAVIPDLNDPRQYIKILELNRGSCTPKHFLLCNMFQKLGLQVLYTVYPYKWDEFESLYPPGLMELARIMPLGYHLACKVEIEGKLVLVDATLDPALEVVGLPVNKEWDGTSDMLLPVHPCGEEQLHHPYEAHFMQTRQYDEVSLVFYEGLNSWMEAVRVEASCKSSTNI